MNIVLLIHLWRQPEDNKLPDGPTASRSSGGLPIRLGNLGFCHTHVTDMFMEIWSKLPPVFSKIYSQRTFQSFRGEVATIVVWAAVAKTLEFLPVSWPIAHSDHTVVSAH